ncbi:hypothetical protein AMECASPLE_030219 [Ameca splendens]|uniref:Uncharacterized protein n=1 Tax=Ameca splendens TaxID=208324 RepID=A0ABV1ACA2_9TELE
MTSSRNKKQQGGVQEEAGEQAPAKQYRQITGFKQKEEWANGYLDRANHLNTFFNRFSSGTSSASFSPALCQTDIPPSCHTSNVLSFTLAMDPSASTCLPSTISEDADASFASTFHLCVSRSQVKRQLD